MSAMKNNGKMEHNSRSQILVFQAKFIYTFAYSYIPLVLYKTYATPI